MRVWIAAVAAVAVAFGMSGCDYKTPKSHCKKAVYITKKELRESYPKVVAPREIEKAAKIYNYRDGDILLINEENKGIHVIDNRVRETPKNVAFIEIPGNIDMAVKNDYLYVDSFTDLLVLDISDIGNIRLVHRKKDLFPYDMYQAERHNGFDKSGDQCYDYDYTKQDAFVIGYE